VNLTLGEDSFEQPGRLTDLDQVAIGVVHVAAQAISTVV
jgi:hypothetical protein